MSRGSAENGSVSDLWYFWEPYLLLIINDGRPADKAFTPWNVFMESLSGIDQMPGKPSAVLPPRAAARVFLGPNPCK